MKKKAIFLLPVIICQLMYLNMHAQTLTDEWRLIIKSWKLPNGETSRSEYGYDDKGNIKEIKNYEGKKLHSAVSGIVYNSSRRISSYKESFTDGADTIQHLFSYDDLNRLSSIIEVKFKKGGKRTVLTRTLIYTSNGIKESKIQPSFGGKLTDEIIYSLDEKNNMVRKTTIQDGKKIADYIYGAYDNKPNPLVFTGAFFYTELLSERNSKEGHWQNDEKAKTVFNYTPTGMLQNAAVTYILSGKEYTHQYFYTYAKVKSLGKPGVK